MKKSIAYILLVVVNLVYACVSVFMKLASAHAVLSWQYLLCLFGAFVVMGVYAIMWQQIIRRMDLSTAYMFKGTSLIFVLLLSVIIFGETITLTNIIGSAVIIGGVVLYARS